MKHYAPPSDYAELKRIRRNALILVKSLITHPTESIVWTSVTQKGFPALKRLRQSFKVELRRQ